MLHKVFDALSFVIFLLDFTANAKKNFSLNNSFVSSSCDSDQLLI